MSIVAVHSGVGRPKRAGFYVWLCLTALRRFALLAVLIAVWELLAGWIYPAFNPTSRNILPPPSDVLAMSWDMLWTGELQRHVAASLLRVLVGFALSAAAAMVIATIMVIWPFWRRQFSPILQILRPIPPFAWIPIGLLLFGVSDRQSIFVIFIASLFPILLNTLAGADGIETIHRRSALSLGATRWDMLLRVVLPGALPSVFVGLRVGLGFAWMVLVASELIGSTSGLGYLINDSRNLGLPSLALVGMSVIGLIGYALDVMMRAIEGTLLRWNT